MSDKFCSIITGVTRPNAERVFKNLETTLSTLSKYDCKHYALTYISEESLKLEQMIEKENLPVKLKLIEPIKEIIGGWKGNCYRMVRCIELLAKEVENFESFTGVIRHRIDCELEEIEIPNVIEENVYYAPTMQWGPVFDNIGIMTPSVFNKVFYTDGVDFGDKCPHTTLENAIASAGFTKKPFNFKKKLYQSNESEVMGVPQWSKMDRTFHYNDEWVCIH